MSVDTLEAVERSVLVAVPPERAFEIFTDRIGDWWPLERHSINGDDAVTAVVEGREGGRVYERTRDGREATWGRILAWEPPNRLVLTWEVTRAPTELELRFAADGAGTRVELVHRGWEALGERGEDARGNYDGGWDFVLGRYVDAV